MNIINKYNGFEILINNKSIKLYNKNKDKIRYKLYNLELYYKAINWLIKNDKFFRINLSIFWIKRYSFEIISYIKAIKDYNDKLVVINDNIININGKQFLSIDDNFSKKNRNFIYTSDIILNDIFNNHINKKHITILLNNKYKNNVININRQVIKFKKDKIYKIQYITYSTLNKIEHKILPSSIHININNINKIKLKNKFDIALFHFKKYNKKAELLSKTYFKDFYKLSQFCLENINKNGCVILPTHECFHKNYLNYICYLSQYFKKIMILSYNNDIIKLTYWNNVYIVGINFNGKKINKFDSKYNYNDENSLKIKEEFINFVQNNINQIINDYLNIKDTINMSLEEIFLNNINNIKLYLIKNNMKTNLLINDYFNKFNTKLLFDLNFFIKICIQYDILNIYYLENTEYTEYLVNIMIPQYEKDFKYIKYEKNLKILKNNLLYLNTDDKIDFKILLKFDNIIIKKEYANFFEDFYIKDKNENYYFLKKNEFRPTN
jgi:hypothetical protein